tara:strand:+ start:392 stop:607 length:216 start_codon:yes stop_codon:yes gene_type:complete
MTNSIYHFESISSVAVNGAFYKYVEGFFTKECEEELINGKKAFVMKNIQTRQLFYIIKDDCVKATIFDRRK